MSSIIEGYNYDIFISYRQKDNKHDGWVTEFVNNLKGELESTFKEEISVYFDINPHDGLLETHDVGASLKEKLKCLIFIPILSRTYCDSKSFAWEHEFKAFIEMASQDAFGLMVKLPNGNVASRVLPVRIHDLEKDDIQLCESVMKGVLRGIEFIYRTTGVNRPLLPREDNPNDNLNRTFYRDQVNKVALALKDILHSIAGNHRVSDKPSKKITEATRGNRNCLRKTIISGVIGFLALLVLGYFIVPSFTKLKDNPDKSIAVLPFGNLSSDEDKSWFNEGITDIIINQLSKISELRVLGRTSTLKYRQESKSIAEIGKELNVNYIIEGTVQRQENRVRISVQLIRVKNEDHVWSEVYDRDWKDIFEIQSNIAKKIAEELKTVLTPEEKEQIDKTQTVSSEAYNLYLQGRFYWLKRTRDGAKKSLEYFEKAISLDSDYAQAYAGLADAYYILTWYGWCPMEEGYNNAEKYVLKALSIDKDLVEARAIHATLLCWKDWKWEESMKEFQMAVSLNPNYSIAHSYYSELLDILGKNEEARQQINMALKIDPFFPMMHSLSALFYYHEHKVMECLNESQFLKELDPGFPAVNYRLFNIHLMLGRDLNAIDALRMTMSGDSVLAKNEKQVNEVYNQKGMTGLLTWLIDLELSKQNPSSIAIAKWYSKLNMVEKVLDCLEKAFEERRPELPRINNDPDFDYIRSEPRFQALIKKMGLSEYQKPN